ncbi:fungal-specific transcription factor domain-containing protein [Echria macrotheca]|uniref:Fungal-specific transcription factor domain-containing protein n=1 Tax=Echria macrotheca TaxID=438768 RepID=A0AAJ0BGL4_9PEZI|nr:fungal-specific transcription factor domain-containing protein [Echria macrotheca]
MHNQTLTATADKGPRSRRKTRTGCRTCKIRRVKCDESRPTCQRCLGTGRVCDGYGIWGGGGGQVLTPRKEVPKMQISSCGGPPKLVAILPGMSPQEQAALDFFRHKTSPKMPGAFYSDFWEKLVLQAVVTEPAVLHASIALAATHRSGGTNTYINASSSPSTDDMGMIDVNERLALQQYNLAIRHLQLHLENKQRHSLRVALISCMLFISMELLKGEFRSGRAHLQGALKLLEEIQDRDGLGVADEATLLLRPQPESVDDHLVEAFTRLNVQSALFGQGSEYLYQMGRSTKGSPPPNPSSSSSIPPTFESVMLARRHLDALINRVHLLSAQINRLVYSSSPIPAHFTAQAASLQSSLKTWLSAFNRSIPTLETQTKNEYNSPPLSIALLRMYHTMTTIMSHTALRGRSETVYDQFSSDFKSILTDASTLWRGVIRAKCTPIAYRHQNRRQRDVNFTIDMGFIPPLFYTALKCRVPRYRRFAARFLEASPYREGVWDGFVAGAVARAVMEMEEGEFYSARGVRFDELEKSLGVLDNGVPGDDVPLIPGEGRPS